MYLSNQVLLAAEDRLGLALGHRLLREQSTLQVWREVDAHGYANLKRDAGKYNKMAGNGSPVLMLTDLDRRPCCHQLLEDWLGKTVKPHLNFLLRISVCEAEAWLLAHPEPLAKLFKLPVSKFPTHPETLVDPKAELLKLAAKASSKVRKALLPAKGSNATIGIEYNDILCTLVSNEWDIEIASQHAPSLGKARIRVRELAERFIQVRKLGSGKKDKKNPSAKQ